MDEASGLSKDLMEFLASQEQQRAAGGAGGGAGMAMPFMPESPIQPPPQQQQLPPDFKKWTSLYGCYFDPAATVAHGRRLPIAQLAGCDEPWPQDIAAVCAQLGFQVILERNKRHPTWQFLRNFQPEHGRVRVSLLKPDGTPRVPSIPTKRALMKEVARLMPTHPARLQRIQQVAQAKAQLEAQQAQQAKAAKAAAGPVKKEEKAADKKAGKKGGKK